MYFVRFASRLNRKTGQVRVLRLRSLKSLADKVMCRFLSRRSSIAWGKNMKSEDLHLLLEPPKSNMENLYLPSTSGKIFFLFSKSYRPHRACELTSSVKKSSLVLSVAMPVGTRRP